jgi:hypothetical protein
MEKNTNGMITAAALSLSVGGAIAFPSLASAGGPVTS